MLDMLFLSVGQLAVGLVIAILFMLVLMFIQDEYYRFQWKKRFRIARTSPVYLTNNAAEIRRPGAWQYDHTFFDKITEFHNDISRN